MRHVMACAFGAAGIADLGTQLTQCDGMLTATRSERGAQAADLGAVHVAADAGGHGGDVGSRRQEAAQKSQAWAQALQASMQACMAGERAWVA